MASQYLRTRSLEHLRILDSLLHCRENPEFGSHGYRQVLVQNINYRTHQNHLYLLESKENRIFT